MILIFSTTSLYSTAFTILLLSIITIILTRSVFSVIKVHYFFIFLTVYSYIIIQCRPNNVRLLHLHTEDIMKIKIKLNSTKLNFVGLHNYSSWFMIVVTCRFSKSVIEIVYTCLLYRVNIVLPVQVISMKFQRRQR